MARPPSAVLRYLKLPDNLERGRFDEYGHPVADGQPASLVLYPLPGGPFPPWQVWGVFDRPLDPGQYGYLIFTNVPGQATPGGAFTEWDASRSTPTFSDQLLTVYSVQRAPGSARIIGCNESGGPVHAAAGMLFVAPPAPGPSDAEAPAAEAKSPRRSR